MNLLRHIFQKHLFFAVLVIVFIMFGAFYFVYKTPAKENDDGIIKVPPGLLTPPPGCTPNNCIVDFNLQKS